MLEHLDDFLLHLQTNNYSQETIKNYERDLLTFELFLKESNYKFSSLDKLKIEEYKAYLASIDRKTPAETEATEADAKAKTGTKRSKGSKTHETLSSRSINRMLSSLRSYLSFLVEMDYSYPLPPNKVTLIKTERKKARVAELNDLIKVIEAPSEFEKNKKVALRNRAMLEVLFATGVRISELINLNCEQLDGSGKIFVRGKGRKERFVYLTPRAQQHLENYLANREDESPALFVPYRGSRAPDRKKRISANYLQSKIKEYVRRLRVNVPTSAHSLRHGYATYLVEKGASPAAVQKLLGHESPATTDRYIHASDKFAEESHKKYHPLYKADE